MNEKPDIVALLVDDDDEDVAMLHAAPQSLV